MFKLTIDDAIGTNVDYYHSLDELAGEGARRTIAAALELKVEEYLKRVDHLRGRNKHAVAVRNGKAWKRIVQMGAGSIKIPTPPVHDRRKGKRFTNKILPP